MFEYKNYSRRCIHSETLEGKQQIQAYGTPICVEGVFALYHTNFQTKLLKNLKRITALKMSSPDLYTDQGATESNSDPKSFDTARPDVKKNKVNNSLAVRRT